MEDTEAPMELGIWSTLIKTSKGTKVSQGRETDIRHQPSIQQTLFATFSITSSCEGRVPPPIFQKRKRGPRKADKLARGHTVDKSGAETGTVLCAAEAARAVLSRHPATLTGAHSGSEPTFGNALT